MPAILFEHLFIYKWLNEKGTLSVKLIDFGSTVGVVVSNPASDAQDQDSNIIASNRFWAAVYLDVVK